MNNRHPGIVDVSEVEPNTRRGGDLRALLTPTTVGSTSGFMGVAIIQPGDRIAEHYHPYSEEFIYVLCGQLEVDLDGEPHPLQPEQGLLIPTHMRHRFRNVGADEARLAIDYVVHHQKANGSQTTKTFKLTTRTLAPGEQVELSREHSFRPITTRRYYPGPHAVTLQVNGVATDPAIFELEAPSGD